MTNVTIYPSKMYPTYKVYKVIGGWTINYLSDQYTSRSVDGSKVYKSRQNAYKRAKQLNESLPKTLEEVLQKADTAEYSWDGYYVYISDETTEGNGYYIAICKEAMPPHQTQYKGTLDEVETFLDGSLGYTRESRVWKAVEREDD